MPSSLLIRTKLSDEQVRNIIWGFACGAPKAHVAAQTGVSEKRVISLILALRSRLTRPPFFRWNAPSDVFLTYDMPEAEIAARKAIFGVIAMCYADKRCASNYLQKRRKHRICKHCMIAALFDEAETTERTVAFVDVIRAFYQHVGIGGERRGESHDIMHLRWRHTMIVHRAREQSQVQEQAPAFNDTGERSCRALYDRLITDLETEPLSV